MATAAIDPKQATSIPAVLALLQAGQITADQASQRIAELTASTANANPLRHKFGEKGTLSVYGLTTRFPVSLYPGQWVRLLEYAGTICQALAADDVDWGKADKGEYRQRLAALAKRLG